MTREGVIGSARTKLWPAVLLPSIGNIIFVSLVFVLAFKSGQGLLADGDTGYHIRTGELILRTWQVPTHDPYAFHYPPLRWTAHEWLSEIIMAGVFRAAGLTGIVLFFALLLAVTHWLLYKSLRSRSNDIFLCVIVTLLATATSSTHWLARPHVFSLLLTIIWCRCLDRFQYGNQNRLLYLPFLMLLWVNLHGGFIIGLILSGVYLTGNLLAAFNPRAKSREHKRKAKALLGAFIASLFMCLINPYGIEILWFPFRVAGDRFIMDRVTEFLSPNFHEGLPFKYMFLVTIGAVALSRSALNLIELMLLLLLSYMALYSTRHVSLFAIVISPILLRRLEDIFAHFPHRFLDFYHKHIANLTAIDSNVKGYVWPAVSVLSLIGLLAAGTLHYSFNDKSFPVAAVEFLKREPITGNMFNNDEFGDYLIFTAWPAYRVFIDGRSDMYGEKYGSDYLRAANAQHGWKEVFERHNITWVLFNTESPLAAALQEQRDWQPIYADRVASIFVKKVPAHASLLAKYNTVTLPKR